MNIMNKAKTTQSHKLSRLTTSPVLGAALLFVTALAVRLPYLGEFMTIDEIKWVEGAGQFLLALRSGNLAGTYWHFFPGITTTWFQAGILWLQWLVAGDSANLDTFVTTQITNLHQTIGAMRLSQVLMTALLLPGLYLLARPLLGNSVALLGGFLLALDPFFTAHSRIVNGDSATAGLMLASMLAFVWLFKGSGQKMAALSGALGGLALLTKVPAPMLIPWIGLLAGAGYFVKRDLWFWTKALLGWGLSAAAVFVLLWPAMWVGPITTLLQMYHETFAVGEVGSGHDAFFMAQVSDDPGRFFYPVAVAFRLTPITTVGLGLALVWLLAGRAKNKTALRPLGWGLLAYVLFVILAANVSPKKLDRYVMAVFPALDLLAALGLWGAWRWVAPNDSPRRRVGGVAALLVILGQAAFTVTGYPYLLTQYNPLLGGTAAAVNTVPVGWGEGLEQAAAYLNRQPNAGSAAVSSWYSDLFNLYSVGRRASFSDDGRGQLSADYVVFYVNQIQRQKPYPALIDYFRAQPPVFVVNTTPTSPNGLGWVEVYKAPAAQSASGPPEVEGIAQLLAYKVAGPRVVAQTSGQSLDLHQLQVTLFLRVLGPLPPDTTFGLALAEPSTGQHWADWQPAEMKGNWTPGSLVEWPGQLSLPPDLPPGDYKLWFAFQFTDGKVIAEFPISNNDPPIELE